ncbi:DnaB-like helicase N-terminal domain-containing protein [Kitasatospora sp. NPDC093550]|uniref:DnaB-like helicase N-terminal domain-containing protein n=1 Tax=Kitasatospora sp. NPDC093550 TaxID=3364089 RepID=UPI003823687C
MTNPDLALRAEQAVIGAALRDPQQLDQIAYLTPDRLAHPTNRALLGALIESRTSNPAAPATRMPELVAQKAAVRGVGADYLRRLADAAPQPRAIASYARLVQEAAVRRDLALHLDRLRAPSAGQRGPEPALDRLTQRLEQAPLTAKFSEPAPEPYQPRPLPANSQEVRLDLRLERQDTVLADLLQNPEHIREVSAWLYPEAFEAGPRREVYEAIVVLAERGDPVDTLTVEWEVNRQDPERYEVKVEVTVEERPDYLARLATTAVVVGAAVELGGEIMAEDIRATLANDFGSIDVTARGPGAEPKPSPDVRVTGPVPQVEPAPLLQPPPAQQAHVVQPNVRP